MLLMVLAGAAMFWLLTSDEFEMDQAEVSADVRYADVEAMLAAVGVAPGEHPNLFALPAEDMRRSLAAFPGIADATVRAVLPDRVVVTIEERDPVLVLRRPAATFVVDGSGIVLATIDEVDIEALALPVVDDRRAQWATEVAVGEALDETDLAALLQLGALTPDTIGSAAGALALSIDDENGFVLTAEPQGWQAVFGHYTPTLRPVDIVPRQVQCLRSLIVDAEQGEDGIQAVYLAPLDEGCGTFRPRAIPTPRESPTPDPSA
jgi:hypothetical protein